ncbi:MAG TPA: FCD domain-containing protein [Aquamicrobium sp.]|nr:FCD domain-containing protein [Aquamicrobium sp.]
MSTDEDVFNEELRRAVETCEGRLVTDGRLAPERELMRIFGVSRRSVRAALQDLERQGLLFRQRGQGTFLRPTSPNARGVASLANSISPVEIMEVRQQVEPTLARLAALRAAPVEVDQIRRLAQPAAAATNSREYERWDSAFHAKIAQCARNRLFLSIFKLIENVRFEQNWMKLRSRIYSDSLRDRLVTQHVLIIDAIEARDPDAAENAMRDHLRFLATIAGTPTYQGAAEQGPGEAR